MRHRLAQIGVLMVVLAGIGCHKGDQTTIPPCDDFLFPSPFDFEIKENGRFMTDSVYLSQLQLIDAANNQTVGDFGVSSGLLLSDGIRHYFLRSVNVGLSSVYGSKNFILEYPDGSKDRMYVNVVRPSDSSNCGYLFKEALFNGVLAGTDTLCIIEHDSTYVLNHQ